MQRRFQDPTWWDSLVREHGRTPQASDYSDESHAKRLTAVSTAIASAVDSKSFRVLDIPCGVGLLQDALLHKPTWYTGADFSEEALASCQANLRTPGRCVRVDLHDNNWPIRCAETDKFDIVVCCGLFCFSELFADTSAAIVFIKEALCISNTVIANFPWQGFEQPYRGAIQQYTMDGVVQQSRRARMGTSLQYGYLPHEFLGTFR